MHLLETYLRDLRDTRATGAAVKETSYYGALAALLNEVGKTLKPRVRCVINIRNQGAGLPDGGLFTQEQFQRSGDAEPLPGQLPARGVIEVKGTGDDAWLIADSKQVSRYWEKYRQVLVTNYRDFVLLGEDGNGNPVKLESFRLAPSEREFWAATASPRKAADEQGDRFVEFLKRVLLHAARLTDPKDVAWFLASYAREAKVRIEKSDTSAQLALAHIREALQEALGITFQGDEGIKFFRRIYAEGRHEPDRVLNLGQPMQTLRGHTRGDSGVCAGRS